MPKRKRCLHDFLVDLSNKVHLNELKSLFFSTRNQWRDSCSNVSIVFYQECWQKQIFMYKYLTLFPKCRTIIFKNLNVNSNFPIEIKHEEKSNIEQNRRFTHINWMYWSIRARSRAYLFIYQNFSHKYLLSLISCNRMTLVDKIRLHFHSYCLFIHDI